MLKYYEWLIRIREYVKKAFNLDILYNLEDYPIDKDESMDEYYEKIAILLDNTTYSSRKPSNRYYIQKCKPFFIHGKIYYEITVTPADDFSSKFNRFTVFSNREIPNFYAIKLDFIDAYISILDREMPIRIINSYQVAIRQVELKKIALIVGVRPVSTGSNEYHLMMDYLTHTGKSLTEIIDLGESYYNSIKLHICSESKSNNFFDLLDVCRKYTQSNKKGCNVLRYLLYRLRNKIINPQLSTQANNWISYLCLQNGCLPFEEMPYATSLLIHNPPLLDLFACISSKGREHELLARKVRINTEQNVQLFTPISELQTFSDIEQLIHKYNNLLPDKHKISRKLVIDGDKIFIQGYVSDTVDIIKNLSNRVGDGLKGYSSSIATWINNDNSVDCEEKKGILQRLFDSHDLALIYGAAGTGKTTLIRHIATYFSNASKLFLANTHPAKEHLRRQIKIANSEFSTIASSKPLLRKNRYDIVFIDECSTVDNLSMKELLGLLNCRLMVLVGDTYQIQSISFGNWFGLAKAFLPNEIIYELNTPYRSKNPDLIPLWNKVRLLDENITEFLYKKHFSSDLDDSILAHTQNDKIILCLNYDGLYGVNNLNRFLQNDNPNTPVYWDSWVYKVNDPIIFNEFNRFYPTLYNNLKGWIRKVTKSAGSITFEVEVDMPLNEFDVGLMDFELLDCKVPGHSLIRFSVDNYDDDEGERGQKSVIPFQVAYAISIHKAQGLEYDSVKVIITNQIEELITHNIFYTAITRARNDLKIYWTPETQQTVLTNMKLVSYKRDAYILSNKYGLTLLSTPD
ncbi:MAG: ATP-dependent RecD-like DNA helicase [Bacilli bacterium]|nr:ATP-dependent RecD-like DNA helicase [Bacilli bacterium]